MFINMKKKKKKKKRKERKFNKKIEEADGYLNKCLQIEGIFFPLLIFLILVCL